MEPGSQNQKLKPVVGLLGIGLDTYWPQFEGLRERLAGYQEEIARAIASLGVEIADAGLIDNPDAARQCGEFLRGRRVDALFLFISTYALSHTMLPIVQTVGGVPIFVLNLQPVAAIDYAAFNRLGDRGRMTGEWLAHCQACSVPEIANVLRQAGIGFQLITGYLHEPYVWEQVGQWIAALRVRKALREARFGVLGHYYGGMLDVYTDMTRLATVFGSHFELLETGALQALRQQVAITEIEEKVNEFRRTFEVDAACEAAEILRAAQTACGLERLVQAHRLDGLAYYFEGQPGSDDENIVTSIIVGNTLLTAHHVPVAGECEIKNLVAMKIMDLLDAGGSFSEFYAMDFVDDVVLLGHDGPAHAAIAERGVGVVPVPVYHGKPGRGLSIQMEVKNGPVTLLSLVHGTGGSTFFLVAEGESVPGPTLKIGNTNSRYRFSLGAREFVNRWSRMGPAHHCAIGIGHAAETLEKLAALIGIQCERVC